MLKIKILRKETANRLIFIFVFSFIFVLLANAEVIYVKKKGDGGPPPEGYSPSKEKSAGSSEVGGEYSLPENNSVKPNSTANIKESYKSCYVLSGNKNSKMVALTFDDGPNVKYTPGLLSILKEKNVKATFFLLGEQVKLYPSQAKAIADEGHEIGNHSYSHVNFQKSSKEIIEKEIKDTQDITEQTTGKKPVILRPPYGNGNQASVEIAKKYGINNFIFWTVDTNDWKSGTTKDSIVNKTIRETKGGGIILLHDRFTKSVDSVREIIDKLKEQGYSFVTISELLADKANPKIIKPGIVETPKQTNNTNNKQNNTPPGK